MTGLSRFTASALAASRAISWANRTSWPDSASWGSSSVLVRKTFRRSP